MKTQKKIENWCRDEKFMRYADKRMGEAFNDVVENQPLDPQYEELDEEFEWNDRYVVPLADYLTYRLHLAKLQKNLQKRRSGIWWVFTHVFMLGHYLHVFAGVFAPLVTELHETVMTMLHREYVNELNGKNR